MGSSWERLGLLASNAGFAWLVLSEQAAFSYSIALLSETGVGVMMAGMVMLVILPMAGLDGRVTRPRQVALPAALAVLPAFGVLASAVALRWNTIGGP